MKMMEYIHVYTSYAYTHARTLAHSARIHARPVSYRAKLAVIPVDVAHSNQAPVANETVGEVGA